MEAITPDDWRKVLTKEHLSWLGNFWGEGKDLDEAFSHDAEAYQMCLKNFNSLRGLGAETLELQELVKLLFMPIDELDDNLSFLKKHHISLFSHLVVNQYIEPQYFPWSAFGAHFEFRQCKVERPNIVLGMDKAVILDSLPLSLQGLMGINRKTLYLASKAIGEGEAKSRVSFGKISQVWGSYQKRLSSTKKPVVKKELSWEKLVKEKYRCNPSLSHLEICKRLGKELGINPETLRRKTTNPRRR